MTTATCSTLSFMEYPDKLSWSSAAQGALTRFHEALKESGIIIRFENGYGAAIKAASPEGNVKIFEMLLLRFHGPGVNDYRTAQYKPLPEYNRGPWEEIVSLCREVALLGQVGQSVSLGG
jgi:hypothetical protein